MHEEHTADTDTFPVGTLQPVGRYCFHLRDQRWEWSPEMYRIHGFEPGEVVPTTALVMRHKHPAESEVGRRQIAEAVHSGEPFSFRQRIVNASGNVRTVVVVGAGVTDETGRVIEVRGYMVDVSRALRQDCSSAVAAAFEHRGLIEQSKGMLMLIHGTSADAAFRLLQQASQHSNTKLHVLAERLVALLTQPSGARGMKRLERLSAQVLCAGRMSPLLEPHHAEPPADSA
ncbi:MAG TPA: PAS and ANTAR domain-containing protein [Nocardioidaceae bacterium]|nr:PAS and ANTAR domain-containing protein [Nocardioidaceae bacterium]